MKRILILSLLLWTVSAVPGVLQAVSEAAVESPVEDGAAVEEAAVESPVEDVAVVEEASVEYSMEDEAAPEVHHNFCPHGWFSSGPRCFKFFSLAKTWYQAEEHCHGLGGHLASATNPQEYSFLQEMTRLTGQTYVWLGGFYLQGNWMWIDGKGFYYSNWSRLPSSSAAASSSCIVLHSSVGSGWTYTTCHSGRYFFCSMNPFGC